MYKKYKNRFQLKQWSKGQRFFRICSSSGRRGKRRCNSPESLKVGHNFQDLIREDLKVGQISRIPGNLKVGHISRIPGSVLFGHISRI